MARAYSDDLRRKLLEAHEQGEGSLRELARRFHVSEAWAFKISSTRSRTGKTERPPGARRGRKSRITAEAIEYLRLQVKVSPDRPELQEGLRSQRGVEIGITRLWTVLKQMGLVSEKKSLHASEQDSERVKTQRQFWQREAQRIDPAQLVFVDESGVTTEMTRKMLGAGQTKTACPEGTLTAHPAGGTTRSAVRNAANYFRHCGCAL